MDRQTDRERARKKESDSHDAMACSRLAKLCYELCYGHQRILFYLFSFPYAAGIYQIHDTIHRYPSCCMYFIVSFWLSINKWQLTTVHHIYHATHTMHQYIASSLIYFILHFIMSKNSNFVNWRSIRTEQFSDEHAHEISGRFCFIRSPLEVCHE